MFIRIEFENNLNIKYTFVNREKENTLDLKHILIYYLYNL